MSWIEWVAAFFGVVCVFWTITQNVWSWPAGLVQVVLYVYVFADAKLYSDAILSAIYVPLQVYGWWAWARGGVGAGELRVTRIGWGAVGVWLAAAGGVTAGWGWYMSRTDAAYPYWDAAVLALSLAATYLQARRALESWWFWIAVDLVAVPLYWVKDLHPTAGLYVLFLGMAVSGAVAWRRAMVTAVRGSEVVR